MSYDRRMLHSKSMSRWVIVSLTSGMAAVLACGPFFPEDALDKPSGILQPPVFHFRSELNRLPLPEKISSHPVGTPAYTLDLEMVEMAEIVLPLMPDTAARDSWLERYRSLRRAMIGSGDASKQQMVPSDKAATLPWSKARQDLTDIIAPLPQDLRLYLEGAAAWLDGREAAAENPAQKARESWQQLLALPADQRPWRSTWAAWMLFRTAPHDEQGRWLSETRKLRTAGFKDALHLGIEAAYILGRSNSDYAERAEVSAAEWKRMAMLRAILGLNDSADKLRYDRHRHTAWTEDLARDVVADPFLRSVQMLNIIEKAQDQLGWQHGHHGKDSLSDDLAPWLTSLEQAGITNQQEAVLLAWMYYNAAKFDQARRWLALAPADNVNALSLRGKLAAMRGHRREAEQHLTHLASLLPDSTDESRVRREAGLLDGAGSLTPRNYDQIRRHHFLADCGVAQVARNDFAGALRTFLRSDYWNDSAYIAERLLSVEELLSLSRAGKLPPLQKPPTPPPARDAVADEEYYPSLHWNLPSGMSHFTYLVSRRLIREGHYKDAARLLPEALAKATDRFAEAMRRGRNSRLSREQRAEALWTAAQIERKLGMELFGFETAPDHSFCGGEFELENFARLRAQDLWTPWWESLDGDQVLRLRPVLPATPDELWRARHYAPRVEKRFHYRYVAAELAWKAAALMPDDSEETARVLGIAGGWLKSRDPKAADRFYQALVRRNPSVPLAQKAAKKRWFPNIEWNFDPVPVQVSVR